MVEWARLENIVSIYRLPFRQPPKICSLHLTWGTRISSHLHTDKFNSFHCLLLDNKRKQITSILLALIYSIFFSYSVLPLLVNGINFIEDLCGPMCQPFLFFSIVSIKVVCVFFSLFRCFFMHVCISSSFCGKIEFQGKSKIKFMWFPP